MSTPSQLPPYLRSQGDGVCLSVKVHPCASRNEIAGAQGQELKIKITAPPVDSAANEELVRFLAATLDCPKSAITLLRGHTSRHKVILVQGIAPAEAVSRLAT